MREWGLTHKHLLTHATVYEGSGGGGSQAPTHNMLVYMCVGQLITQLIAMTTPGCLF